MLPMFPQPMTPRELLDLAKRDDRADRAGLSVLVGLVDMLGEERWGLDQSKTNFEERRELDLR